MQPDNIENGEEEEKEGEEEKGKKKLENAQGEVLLPGVVVPGL